jgi:polyphenol oxidase
MRARSSGPTRVPEPPGPTPAWLTPDWPAPANVRAASTLRAPGVSLPPFDGFNLALHVGDAPQAVLHNRRHLRTALALPAEPFWLEQVHGTNVATHGEGGVPRADASVAFAPGQVCAVLTADCLPVLFADRAGTCAGAVHAGWRGLADGVIEATVAALGRPPADLLAWLGPAIGQPAFEVGPEVRERFVRQRPEAAAAFVAGRGDRLPAIAGDQRLKPARSNRKCVNARRLIRRRGASISPGSSSARLPGARPPAWRLHAKSTRNSTAPSDSSTASPTSSPRPDCCGEGSNDGQAGWCWRPVSGMRLAR